MVGLDRARYRVLGLQPGTYIIAALADVPTLGGGSTAPQTVPVYYPGAASIEGAVTVAIAMTDVEGIDFAVGDVPAARVTGAAFDSTGAPLDGTITLAVSHRSGSIVPTPRTTQTRGDGTFTFFNVAAGDDGVQAVRLPLARPDQFDPRVDMAAALAVVTRAIDHHCRGCGGRTSSSLTKRLPSDSGNHVLPRFGDKDRTPGLVRRRRPSAGRIAFLSSRIHSTRARATRTASLAANRSNVVASLSWACSYASACPPTDQAITRFR